VSAAFDFSMELGASTVVAQTRHFVTATLSMQNRRNGRKLQKSFGKDGTMIMKLTKKPGDV